MTNAEILAYLRAAGRPVRFRDIANYFPGDAEEAMLAAKLRLLLAGGVVRRLENGRFEEVRDEKSV